MIRHGQKVRYGVLSVLGNTPCAGCGDRLNAHPEQERPENHGFAYKFRLEYSTEVFFMHPTCAWIYERSDHRV